MTWYCPVRFGQASTGSRFRQRRHAGNVTRARQANGVPKQCREKRVRKVRNTFISWTQLRECFVTRFVRTPCKGVIRPADFVANVYSVAVYRKRLAGAREFAIFYVLFNRCLNTFSTLLKISVSRASGYSDRVEYERRCDSIKRTERYIPFTRGSVNGVSRVSSLLNPRYVIRKNKSKCITDERPGEMFNKPGKR